jgi:hypothetical protein
VATQAKFPGVLPTPVEARRRLGEASKAAQAACEEVEGFKLDVEGAKERLGQADLELMEVERVLVAAREGSPEEASAEQEWDKAWEVVGEAEKGLANVKRAMKAAKAECGKARARLMAVRQDIAAIRLGRRAP